MKIPGGERRWKRLGRVGKATALAVGWGASCVWGKVDVNENGMSDLWEKVYYQQ